VSTLAPDQTPTSAIDRGSAATPTRKPRRRGRPVWEESPHPLVQAVKALALGVSVIAILLPFWTVIATSLADQATINAAGGLVLWPGKFSTTAYQAILSGGVVTRAMGVSIGITVVGTTLSLLTSAGLAYWLSRPGAPLGRPMLILVLGAVLFSPGLIPGYMTVRSLGLIDSYWALILPTLINAFNVIVMRAFFQNIPQELFDAAALDGASSWRVLRSVVIPLSKAVLAVMGLFYAVAYWNAFFNALLYMQDSTKWPMALVLRTYVVNQSQVGGDQVGFVEELPPQLSLQMAILVVAIVPILAVYPFLQRHFAKGVLIGSVKG
jgi:putative aldouronate transport system permease protein